MNTQNLRRFTIFAIKPAMLAALVLTLPVLASAAGQQPGYDQQQGSYGQQQAGVDPPSRVGRLSVMQGNVSFQAANREGFSAADRVVKTTRGLVCTHHLWLAHTASGFAVTLASGLVRTRSPGVSRTKLCDGFSGISDFLLLACRVVGTIF